MDGKTARQKFKVKTAGLIGRLLAYLIVWIFRLLPKPLQTYFLPKLQDSIALHQMMQQLKQQNPFLFVLLEEDRRYKRMAVAVCFFQGLFELVGLGSFLGGYFGEIWWLMVFGGVLAVLDDVIQIGMGVLSPGFPVLLAIVLASVFTPWYVGVFWASGGFKVFNIPIIFRQVFTPRSYAARIS